MWHTSHLSIPPLFCAAFNVGGSQKTTKTLFACNIQCYFLPHTLIQKCHIIQSISQFLLLHLSFITHINCAMRNCPLTQSPWYLNLLFPYVHQIDNYDLVCSPCIWCLNICWWTDTDMITFRALPGYHGTQITIICYVNRNSLFDSPSTLVICSFYWV